MRLRGSLLRYLRLVSSTTWFIVRLLSMRK